MEFQRGGQSDTDISFRLLHGTLSPKHSLLELHHTYNGIESVHTTQLRNDANAMQRQTQSGKVMETNAYIPPAADIQLDKEFIWFTW